MTHQKIPCFICVCFMVAASFYVLSGPVHAGKDVYVPKVLEPWKEWVLYEKEDQLSCIPLYNNPGQVQCAWPGRLVLDLTDRGGTFEQSWQIFTQTRVHLPGSSRHWPRDVLLDNESVVVLEQDDRPGLMLSPGAHTVRGRFSWKSLPEHLKVAPSTGLVSVKVNQKRVDFPDLDEKGRLWLKQRNREKRLEDRLKVECFRLITDDIPARMAIDLTLEVAGQARQMTLGPLYQSGRFIPVALESPLPARLEPDGRLLVQARPGQYRLTLDLRHAGPLETAQFTRPDQDFWPDSEIWAFSSRTDLRRVEISGADQVDPKQTAMPSPWQSYPSYLMQPDTTLKFKQIKRGDPDPAPDQLSLDRTLWLRFDGSGYFIQDRITGKKNTNWRLELLGDIHPGQVSVDGQEQLITREKGSEKAGIELRNGKVNMVVDATFENGISKVPASGWDHDFQSVKGQLYLPPGWTLVNARGVDRIPGTWIGQWTLLDFFVVLIFTIALSRVYSKPLSVLAFITLVLIYHEPAAPKYIWLGLLIGFTLLKYLPKGRTRSVVRLCQGLVLVAFAATALPYAVQALRIGIYPELARPWTSMSQSAVTSNAHSREPMKGQGRDMDESADILPAPGRIERMESYSAGSLLLKSVPVPSPDTYQVMQYDPKARTQTGPGMPLWPAFETIGFSWSGPVDRNHTMSLWLLSPFANLVLAFVRVGLMALLAMGMLGIGKNMKKDTSGPGIQYLLAGLAGLVLLGAPALSHGSDIPSPEMLKELEQRLLKADDCFDQCADLAHAAIDLSRDRLAIQIAAHAAIDTAVPLPGDDSQWLASQVSLDGRPVPGIFKQSGQLWLMIPRGLHQIGMDGPIRRQSGFQLVFPLKPHDLDVTAEGWSVEGCHADGSFDDQLQFKRKADPRAENQEVLETGVLPAFARVERTLMLGLVWKVHTRVVREGDASSGMVLDMGLLPGESITTGGIRVEDSMAKINFKPGQKSLSWESFLTPAGQIRLEHADTRDWTEIWKVDVSPIFHMAYEGTPVIFHKTGERWYPTWHPWPGETLVLTVTRPEAVEGQTLTIEKSLLYLEPGRSAANGRLDLTIKSSQGGRHTVLLPEGARLQEVTIKGRVRPIRQDNNQVVLPIVPGQQAIVLQWVSPEGISPLYKTPVVDLGIPSANTCVDIKLSRSRWPLFIGGEQAVGPAVLFWSEVIVILILAFGLSKTGWTPLNLFQWFLLFIGITMNHPAGIILVAGWLIALDFRPKANPLEGMKFNLVQAGILLLTLAAGACLVFGISNGLLGHPDMSIKGNGSSAGLLRFYHDVSGPVLPRAWVVSIPMWAYRAAMLAWALWVSFWLIRILKWGWKRFCVPQIWAPVSLPRSGRRQKAQAGSPPGRKPRPDPPPPPPPQAGAGLKD